VNLLTDEKELAEIEALCEAATPGPWVIGIQIAARSWPVFSLRDMETATEDEARRDAALIERCRTDFPRAVATIRKLTAALERLTKLASESLPVAQGGVSARLDWELGVDAGRYEAAEIAQTVLRSEEAP